MVLLESTVEQIIPAGEMDLIIKTKPFISIESVTVDGTALDPSDYKLHDEMPYRLELNDIYSHSAYVRYKAGYGSSEMIPADIQGALMLRVGRIYTHPDDPIDKGIGLATQTIKKYRAYDR